MLSGSLPIHLTCGVQLQFVDISSNRLMGLLPTCLSDKSDKKVVKYGGNCLSSDVGDQHPESFCAEEQIMIKKESKVKNLWNFSGAGQLRDAFSSDVLTNAKNSPEKALKWSDRLAVLIGVARAVHFLHTGIIPGFFNNRLKANNILLNEHRMAKLSDYGLSIVADEIDISEVSFDSQEGRRRIVDPLVLASCSQESLSIIISITNKCISSDSSTHPSFEDVLWNLQYAAQVQAIADGDQRSETMSNS
ncbi:leucine-rich repeat protein kinase family protein [Actinidia rufa]|uniref:Leucine-rich repeat protein kinase family protein n=1 Tax=Actinidia rufa TaxID=165716 RepID=A0A7J0H315_9ERIC|nr:leucine-rich repeat protein kinase family protein [Actinidia rufa]